jgi:hypothetical protein
VDRSLRQWVWEDRDGEAALAAGIERIAAGTTTPYKLASEIVAGLREESGNGR